LLRHFKSCDPSCFQVLTHLISISFLSKQLPEPTWTKNEDELFAWYKERDLPVPIGGNFNFIRKSRRIATW
jgi:hypothetical protein